MKKVFALLLLLITIYTASAQQIFSKNAAGHIGENLKVEGKCYSSKFSADSSAIYLYLGTEYPNIDFTIIVGNNVNSPHYFSEERLKAFTIGSWISATGLIEQYQGKPAIKVKDWASLKFITFKDHVPSDYQ